MRRTKQGALQLHRMMKAVAYLRALLEDGTLQPGDRIPSEQELAQALKISRSSLRLTFGCLAILGMLQVQPGIGVVLAEVSPELPLTVLGVMRGFALPQIIEAEALVKSQLAELAARRASHQDYISLAEEVAEMYAATERPLDYMVHAVRFQRAIGRASGNPVLAALIDTLTSTISGQLQKSVEQSLDLREAARLQGRIYKAIRKHQPAEARKSMEQYLHVMKDESGAELPPGVEKIKTEQNDQERNQVEGEKTGGASPKIAIRKGNVMFNRNSEAKPVK
jgi:GntR family transcriptional regulator, transcriptional repressor for pyruvate dehydrogenase complex